MKVKILQRIGIDGRLFEVNTEHDLPEGIALRYQAQGKVKRIFEKSVEPETQEQPETMTKKEKKKLKQQEKKNKLHNPENKENKSV